MDELTAELRSFLDQRRCAVIATHDPGDTIHLTPIWFLFEDGCFYFESSSTSRKVKNVEESPSASVVVDAREPGRERWVSASGPVEIVRDAESASINSRIRRRYLAGASARRPTRSRPRRGGRCDAQACADRVAVLGGAGDGIARASSSSLLTPSRVPTLARASAPSRATTQNTNGTSILLDRLYAGYASGNCSRQELLLDRRGVDEVDRREAEDHEDPPAQRDGRADPGEEDPRVDRMADEVVRAARNELRFLLLCHRCAPVAADVDARPDGEQQTCREEREPDRRPQERLRVGQVAVERAEPRGDERDGDDDHADRRPPGSR